MRTSRAAATALLTTFHEASSYWQSAPRVRAESASDGPSRPTASNAPSGYPT